ncbi:glutathione-dependent formaldehyde-activating enzyme [Mycena leptocephala]|nr:glutathione-dependent formaldehyde-activating enzyme [Mycena leptocephala]
MSESLQPIEYRGNCHCGAFKYTFKAPEIKQAFACTCSICSKNGYLWAFPSKDDFKVVKGDEDSTLKSYEFGKRTLVHKFCPTCGTSVMGRSVDGRFAINIRALADVDLGSLTVATSDGAALKPHYQIPEPVATGPVPEGTTVYHGSCHCGAVGYTLLSPEKISTVNDCDCSICSRDGALWTYPETTVVTFNGLDSLAEYTFANKVVYHGFCTICGVAIRERFLEDTDMALNVRTMNGLDLATVKVEKGDGKSMLPAYEV